MNVNVNNDLSEYTLKYITDFIKTRNECLDFCQKSGNIFNKFRILFT